MTTGGNQQFYHSLEDDYLTWAPKIIQSLGMHFGISLDNSSNKNKPHIPLFNIEIVTNPKVLYSGENTSSGPRTWKDVAGQYVEDGSFKYDMKNPFYCKIADCKRLFKDSNDNFTFPNSKILIKSSKASVSNDAVTIPRQCYHMEFDLGQSGLTYRTGDHLGIWASNSDGSVKKLAKFLLVDDINMVVKFVPNPENRLSETAKVSFPQPCSIYNILKHYLDIQCVLKQHHFEVFIS
jgi:NADPH-ferrihemoprotein reductase